MLLPGTAVLLFICGAMTTPVVCNHLDLCWAAEPTHANALDPWTIVLYMVATTNHVAAISIQVLPLERQTGTASASHILSAIYDAKGEESL